MDDLKPCPFCGGDPNIYEMGDVEGVWWNLECDCGARVSGPVENFPDAGNKSMTNAIAAWNRRAPDPRADRIEALERALRSAEWGAVIETGRDTDEWNGGCPCCHAMKADGHFKDCPLQAALSGTPAPDALVWQPMSEYEGGVVLARAVTSKTDGSDRRYNYEIVYQDDDDGTSRLAEYGDIASFDWDDYDSFARLPYEASHRGESGNG